MDFDVVIQRGTIITASDIFKADVGVKGEKIAAVGKYLKGKQVIDAEGLYVLPGAVDPHTHLEMPVGQTISSDTWFTGTRAAAYGGTTTVIDFVEGKPGQTLIEALNERKRMAEKQAVIDYAFHMTLVNAEDSTLDELPALFEAGVTSFKTYTAYEGFRLTDGELLKVLQTVSAQDGMVMVHAENEYIVQHFTRELLDQGKLSPQYHPYSRPPIAEEEAVARVLLLAEAVDAPLYIVHVSCAESARAIAKAKQRGQRVFGETCVQYLWLTEEEYERPGFEAAKYVCQPPLRSSKDRAALWEALSMAHIQAIGTDHCPFNLDGQKDLGQECFTDIPGGLPSVEPRLALVYSYGVRKGLIDLYQWVSLCCTAPAKIFGLYPRKGSLSPGADADIVLFDPRKEVVLSESVLHENVDYTPYEGYDITGYPVATLLRGKVVIKDGHFHAEKGEGLYMKCDLPDMISTI